MSNETQTNRALVRYCNCGKRIGDVAVIDPELHLCDSCIEKEELQKDMAFLRSLREQHEAMGESFDGTNSPESDEEEREKFLAVCYNDAMMHK